MQSRAEDAPGEPPLTSESPFIVLDTNAVFDWLLFRDPAMTPIVAAIVAGRVRWVATAAMRDEFAHVLGRGLAAERGLDPAGWEAAWALHGNPRPAAPPAPAALRCTDADDQKFIDLACAARARWLVSRDRALLKLRRRAATVAGLTIVPPDRWRLE